MKTELLVPKDECPLNVLAELGDSITNSWIYIHTDAIKELTRTATSYKHKDFETYMAWNAWADDCPESSVCFIPANGPWLFVKKIDSIDINFSTPTDLPEDFIFVKMANE